MVHHSHAGSATTIINIENILIMFVTDQQKQYPLRNKGFNHGPIVNHDSDLCHDTSYSYWWKIFYGSQHAQGYLGQSIVEILNTQHLYQSSGCPEDFRKGALATVLVGPVTHLTGMDGSYVKMVSYGPQKPIDSCLGCTKTGWPRCT